MDSQIDAFALFGLVKGEVHRRRAPPNTRPRSSASARFGAHTPSPAPPSASDDLAQFRHDPFLYPDTVVRGFVLDIEALALDVISTDQ